VRLSVSTIALDNFKASPAKIKTKQKRRERKEFGRKH